MGWAAKAFRRDSNKEVLSELRRVKARGGKGVYGDYATDLNKEIMRRKSAGLMKKSAGKKKRSGFNPYNIRMI